jgi:hypothetical protein
MSISTECTLNLGVRHHSPNPPRRIVQIAVTPETAYSHLGVYSLCNDGSVWRCIAEDDGSASWRQLPEIPQ